MTSSFRVRAAKKVRFDFAPARARRIGLALALGGGITAVAALHDYVDTSQRVAAWEAKLEEVKGMSRRTGGGIRAAAHDPTQLRDEIRRANQVLHRIALPWDGLFSELERRRGNSISLLSLQPDLQNRVVRIAGEARNLKAMVAYVRRLGAGAALYDVRLVDHQRMEDDPQQPIRFTLVAGWR